MSIRWRFALLALLLSTAASPSFGDELEELRQLRDTTIGLVNALVEQGVLTREKADAIIAQARKTGAAPSTANAAPPAPTGAAPSAAPPLAPGTVRVPYVPESLKRAMTEEIRQDVAAQAKAERWGEPGAFPDWLKRFDWNGDLRLRYEIDQFPPGNAPVAILQAYGVNTNNSTATDERLRFRARFGFNAAVSDAITVGVRLSSGGVGSGSNPGSENQTIGSYESRSTIGFDRAYIAYHPLSWLEASAGIVGMPYFEPTSLVWADDVSLGGVVVRFSPHLTPNLKWFTTAGAFPILQIDPTPINSASSKWLYAYQSGIEWKFSDAVSLQSAAALYDYRNIEGIPNPSLFSTAYSSTAASFRQTGNTVFDINGLIDTQNGSTTPLWGLASKFHILNLSTALDLRLAGPAHVIIAGDWVRNFGFNESEIERRIHYQVDRQVEGWQSRVTIGYPSMKEKHAWQGYVGYRSVQRDATLDAFTDQDFHLGGTDAKGYFLGARYSFEKNTFVNLRYFSAEQINGVELAGASLSGLPLKINVTQLDVMTGF